MWPHHYGTCRTITPELTAAGVTQVIEGIELSEDDCGDKIKAALGSVTLDTVVYNAGIGDANGSMMSTGISTQGLDAIDLVETRRMFEVNTFGVIKVAKALVPAINKNGGKWCYVGTLAGSYAHTLDGPFSAGGFAPFMSYRASKGAGMMVTQILASTLKKEGIAVGPSVPCCLSPQFCLQQLHRAQALTPGIW